ncbi:helix-turn-helix domain-containing protein [Mucilaginibacter myungsuensis]|uniref:Helix-turn-helix transcriptional regulator n=1 Tax=Mucilaginibacter myungsuensis TaxID=649104 RepID=A0A929PX10_9SPHI|nr:helix-turn-helix transcriptional regulator [Mucilaginibacter myungsuensis]MBE9661747.1 helix-turn-helix transcriptional regulator [Mucilaginibacter myungsuensis]MDN3599821.1 helix-turn-helix transcriptional regulator [Mucilaginibacter myungsuensis]
MFFHLPEQDVVKVFGRNLRKIRLQRKLSMEKLADMAGMELSQIYRIESGRINAKLTTIAALGKALDVDPNELLRVPNLPTD